MFHKGQLLYALPQARQGIGRMKKAILCEGQLDAIAFHRAGIDCAVAPLGTAFTPEQARMIRRYSNNLILSFDADSAGQKAVLRAAEILLPLSVDLRVLQIPGGKDPDEVFTNQGGEVLKALVEQAVPWLDILNAILPEKFQMDIPAGRAEAAGFVADFLRLVQDQVELEVYIEKVASMLQVSTNAIKSALDKSAASANRPRPAQQTAPVQTVPAVQEVKTDPARVALLELLEIAMASVDNARRIAQELENETLEERDPVVRALNIVINCALNDEMDTVPAELNSFLIETPCPEVSRLLVKNIRFADASRAVMEAVADLRRVRSLSRQQELMERLRGENDEKIRLELLLEISKLNIK